MNAIMNFIQLFKYGHEVANPALWKDRQMAATVVAGLIIGLVKMAGSFGYTLPFDDESAVQLAGGIVVVVNLVLTLITSKRAGVAGTPIPDPVAEPEPAAPVVAAVPVIEPTFVAVPTAKAKAATRFAPAPVQPKSVAKDEDKNLYNGG